MSDERTASASETGSSLAEEEEKDWLPEETKKRVARRPDYMRNNPPCEVCQ